MTNCTGKNDGTDSSLHYVAFGMTARCVGDRRDRHGGNKYSQNGNNISRRVCPFPAPYKLKSHSDRREESQKNEKQIKI